jgi:signal transduction histidine kinase
MRNWRREVPGRTLGSAEGPAELSGRGLGYNVRRTLLTGAATAGLIAAVAATSAALQGEVEPGVVPDAGGRTIMAVSPAGFAWRDGIRPGQSVTAFSAADSSGGWEISTTDGTGLFTSRATPAQDALRATLPLGVVGIVAAGLGLLFLRARRQWVSPAASFAILISSVPLDLRGNPELATLTLAGAAAIPVVILAAELPGPPLLRLGLVAPVAGLLGAWALARVSGWEGYQSLDSLRGLVAVIAVGLLALSRFVLPATSGTPMSITRPRLVDALLVSGLTGLALTAIYVLHFPPLLIGAVAIGLVLALAPVRRVSQGFRNAVLADMRAEAAAQGAELERARLARELHDVPLQELIGVIRRLEVLPGAESESDDLRALAGHLRGVAADLRPPVLDDFGLPAALAQVAEEATTDAVPVTTEITDTTGMEASQRPPPDVELAMYRIAHEAGSNALEHARATQVRIVAQVTSQTVNLEIRDDGTGIEPGRRARAAREKHLGLATMRRRAQAIDAEFSIDADRRRGTTIRVGWRR